MAASGPICLIGITVISVASSGVRHLVKKSYLSFNAMKSGRYLPAWRIIQTGGLSTVSPFNAFKKRSFFIILEFFYHLHYHIFNTGFGSSYYVLSMFFSLCSCSVSYAKSQAAVENICRNITFNSRRAIK